MKRAILVFVHVLTFSVLTAQEPFPPLETEDDSTSRRVKILNSDVLSFSTVDGIQLQKLIGNVKILQDSTIFYCDSAYYFEAENRIEAFSNVRVEMPDSVVMLARRATYDGNTRIAEAFKDITLTDRSVTLETDHLTYDRNEEFGFFDNNGTLLDGETKLTSLLGYYYPQENMSYFKKEVVLESPDYTLYTDTLAYDTELKIARFITETTIVSESGEIVTTNGNYDTEVRRVNLFERSQVTDSTYILSADTLFYDDAIDMGYAIGQVVVDQKDTTLQLKGNYGEFNRDTDESLVTDNPVAIQIFENDTLFLFADTLRSIVQTRLDTVPYRFLPNALSTIDSLLSDSTLMDSVALASYLLDSLGVDTFRVDTQKARIFKGYYDVTFYMNELQGKCDSLVYFYDDSMLLMYRSPMLWAEENQLYGDTIKVWMKNGEADSMWLGANSFLVSEEDTVGFNQMKGKEMRASFRNGDMYRLAVIGNSESIYFAKEEDTTETRYQGMNQALAQAINLYFEDNELQKIVFLSQPEGSFKPMFEVLFQPNRLDGMKWLPENRPPKPDGLQIMTGLWPPVPIGGPILEFDPEEPLPFEGEEEGINEELLRQTEEFEPESEEDKQP